MAEGCWRGEKSIINHGLSSDEILYPIHICRPFLEWPNYCFQTEKIVFDFQHLPKLRVSGAGLVSARLVEAENLDWRLFRVADQKLIKWFGKSCYIFERGLHLNLTKRTSLPTSVVYKQHQINSPLSRKLHLVPFKFCKPHKYAISGGHFQCLWKLPRCTFGGFSILQR